MYNSSTLMLCRAAAQPCSQSKGCSCPTPVLGRQLRSLFMPAVNRRVRSEATRRQAVQNCAALLAIQSHNLVKVRSIGNSDAAGDSEVQVRANLLPCPPPSDNLPQHSSYLGSYNILCFQAVLATGESLSCTLPKDLHSQLLFRGSGFFVIAPDSSTSTVTPLKPPGAELPANNDAKGWTVVYVLADEDPPDLARQGHWYAALS